MCQKKRVLLLAVSCKNGGLCPGGIDLDNPSEWIRIVRDDGQAGSVQYIEIAMAKPLDTIEFEGKPVPLGKQKENWAIVNNSCRRVSGPPSDVAQVLKECYDNYGYSRFWGSPKPYLTEEELDAVDCPSESILEVSNVRIFRNNNGKVKIDFSLKGHRVTGISITDQEYFDLESDEYHDKAYLIVAIPRECNFLLPSEQAPRAYKFVSKVYPIT